jgi:hypothetical protein
VPYNAAISGHGTQANKGPLIPVPFFSSSMDRAKSDEVSAFEGSLW